MILKIKEAREGAPCVIRRALRVVVRASGSDRARLDRDGAVLQALAGLGVDEHVRADGQEVRVDERVSAAVGRRRVVVDHHDVEDGVQVQDLLVAEVVEYLVVLGHREGALRRRLEHLVDRLGDLVRADRVLGVGLVVDGLHHRFLRDREGGLRGLLGGLVMRERGRR
jgi:hypothetical protein